LLELYGIEMRIEKRLRKMQILPLLRVGLGDGLLSHLEDCLVKLLMANKGTRDRGDSRYDGVGERRKTKTKG
jgi:hypothetical protein